MNGRPHGGYARRFLALAALTALMGATVSCSGTGGSKPVSSATKTLRWGGRDRSYAIDLEHTVNRQTPIVLVLHLLQSAAGTTPGFSGFAEQAARRGAIVVLPEGYQFSWNAGVCCGAAVTKQIDDLGFLQRLLSIIQHQFGDQTRPVYVVGFSNGGFMALRLACAGTRLAGIAIVEASLGVARCDPLPMDLLQIHQLGDQIVPYLGAEHPSVPGASQPFLSVPSTFERWRSAAGCAARGTTNARALGVRTVRYPCPAGTRAELVTMPGGSHGWPTSPAPVDASRAILRFLRI